MSQTFLEALDILKDIGLVEVVAPLILIWVLVYGLLVRSKALKPDLAAMVAFAVALIAVMNPYIRAMILDMTPFFTMFLIIILLVILLFLLLGANQADIVKALSQSEVHYFLVFISLLFVFISMSNVFGPEFQPVMWEEEGWENATFNKTGDPIQAEVIRTLVNPGFLGVLLLIGIFGLTVYMISRAA